MELLIYVGIGLTGAEWGAALSRLMQHNTTLERLDCSMNQPFFIGGWLDMEGVRALVPGLRVTNLKGLALCDTRIGDDALGVLVDGLVGNTKMDTLGLSDNGLTSKCLVHITKLLRSTRVQTIYLDRNDFLFHGDESEQDLQRFMDSL